MYIRYLCSQPENRNINKILKIARRNINNLRYADDTTLMAAPHPVRMTIIKTNTIL